MSFFRWRPVTVQWTLFTAVLLMMFCGTVRAAAIGMPDQTARAGLVFGWMAPSIDATEYGAAADDNALQASGIVYTDWLSDGRRYWAEAYYQQAGQEATTAGIGQNIAQYGARISLQQSVPVVFGWQPWLGIGLDVSQVHYTDRHSVDPGGFLSRRYADRTDIQPAVLVNLITEWNLTRHWDVIARLEQMFPLQDGIGGFSVALGALYTY
ncbi:MAG: Uncharacterized protein FD165_2375 [Gammaproteobacteria bacterium]|nr:MAG: Uncharacterized protein FD165_2375 [Gammaproteobacteria bacterium]TND01964.1 MAG: Uncharacterized protein FD120_2492 [Gammaproteobacteria bacterium]